MANVTRREFALLGGATVALNSSVGLMGCATSTVTTQRPNFDLAVHVHPELRAAAAILQKQFGTNASISSAAALAAARKAGLAAAPRPEPQWTERTIAGRNGAPDVRIYIVNASADVERRPAILHIHGGGFILGSAEAALSSVQEHAAALDCVIVSVEYRLAPETPFPGPLEDNYAALSWLYDNATELGVDRSRIAVMGESAGGGHAAMLAIAARDRGEVPLVFQCLIYPMLDDRTGSTREVSSHIGKLLWTRDSNRFGWTSLLGTQAGSRNVPHGAVPARVEDLRGLPATFIGVGSIDLFVNEDIEYARRLIDAGVSTELNVVPGAFHGFETFVPDASISKQFKAAVMSSLSRAFERGG